ncbi:MAG: ThiF family adenylyltransferase [Jatrophihabitans sp.]
MTAPLPATTPAVPARSEPARSEPARSESAEPPTGEPSPALATARLNAATVLLWRSEVSLQLELGLRRVVIDNVAAEQVSPLLVRPEGRQNQARASPADSCPTELAGVLAAAGFLTEQAPGEPDAPLAAQYKPELAALTGRHGDAAAAVLANRGRAAVAVHGTSRITASIASTLASAGVGWVQLVHGGDVAAADACPGGLTPTDEGSRFGVAGVAAIHRCAPGTQTVPIPRNRFADLVILTDPAPVEPSVRASLHLDGLAHLPVTVDGSSAVIGPLVAPGISSCLRCADLHRCERDPCWPMLAVQLAARPRRRIGSEVALCLAAAGLAAGQALAFLDGRRPETVNATLEWQLPDWRLRRRSWPAHHDCDCGAATGSAKHGRMGS